MVKSLALLAPFNWFLMAYVNYPVFVSMQVNHAESYNNILVPAIFQPWAHLICKHIKQGDNVLDAGCGTGVITRQAIEQVGSNGSVTGIDLNQNMLDIAKSRSSSDIEWFQADVTELPFDDNQFDVVTCQQVLQFVPDKQKALDELYRVLRPNGRLTLAVWKSAEHSPGWKALQDSLSEIINEPYPLPPFSFDQPNKIEALATTAGFKNIALSTVTKQTHFKQTSDFVFGIVEGSQNMLGKLSELAGDIDGIRVINQKMEIKLSTYIDDKGLTFDQPNNVLHAIK
ncbi:MAG: hypothetical protein COB26_08265 [Piscirickettsiaceae bacterium]|nr:MAG: hypothetical protein COB26_08265 [Piscirickettsiaceae bacterium]